MALDARGRVTRTDASGAATVLDRVDPWPRVAAGFAGSDAGAAWLSQRQHGDVRRPGRHRRASRRPGLAGRHHHLDRHRRRHGGRRHRPGQGLPVDPGSGGRAPGRPADGRDDQRSRPYGGNVLRDRRRAPRRCCFTARRAGARRHPATTPRRSAPRCRASTSCGPRPPAPAEAGVVPGGTSPYPETDLYLLSLGTGKIYDLHPAPAQQGFPSISGRQLVWQDATFGGDDVFTAACLEGSDAHAGPWSALVARPAGGGARTGGSTGCDTGIDGVDDDGPGRHEAGDAGGLRGLGGRPPGRPGVRRRRGRRGRAGPDHHPAEGDRPSCARRPAPAGSAARTTSPATSPSSPAGRAGHPTDVHGRLRPRPVRHRLRRAAARRARHRDRARHRHHPATQAVGDVPVLDASLFSACRVGARDDRLTGVRGRVFPGLTCRHRAPGSRRREARRDRRAGGRAAPPQAAPSPGRHAHAAPACSPGRSPVATTGDAGHAADRGRSYYIDAITGDILDVQPVTARARSRSVGRLRGDVPAPGAPGRSRSSPTRTRSRSPAPTRSAARSPATGCGPPRASSCIDTTTPVVEPADPDAAAS